MNSMTGFGRGQASAADKGVGFAVEISSVNRKQLDIRPNLPREISGFEPLLRKLISAKISRGTVMARIDIQFDENSMSNTLRINRAAAVQLVEKARELTKALDISGEINISEILTIPGVVEEITPEYRLEEFEGTFSSAVNAALDELLKMRAQEGGELRKDLENRLEVLRQLADGFKEPVKDLPRKQREKIIQRLREADLPVEKDDERLLKEIVIYADRSDATEEITRLHSHFFQFSEFLKETTQPVGRGLDFLAQEMNREITTLGNKAGCPEVTPKVVQFKTELEKIREQVQNVE